MKKIILLIVFCMFISCKPTEKINGFGECDGICRKYDSEKNTTFVYNKFDPILKVVGKWRKLSMNSDFYSNSQIGITNDRNEILYLIQNEIHTCKKCIEDALLQNHKHDFLLESLTRRISFWKGYEKYTVELLETDEESYAVYQLSKENEKKCVFLGFKNGMFYDFTLINSLEDKKQQAKLLLDSYKLN